MLAKAENQANGINADLVAKAFNVSLVVAKEQLLTTEQLGVLCRDEGIEGLFFFPNKFKTKF